MQRTIEKIHQLDFLLIFFFIFLSLSRKKQPHHRTAYSPGARCYPAYFFIYLLYTYIYTHNITNYVFRLIIILFFPVIISIIVSVIIIPISKIFCPFFRKIIGIIVIIHIVGICLFQRTGTTGMPGSAAEPDPLAFPEKLPEPYPPACP